MIAVLGNLAWDRIDGAEPTVGGGPYHAARALRELNVRARIYARCAAADREALVSRVARLGTPVSWVPGAATTAFAHDYEGDRRVSRVDALGEPWRPEDLPVLPDGTRWVHVAPLLRSDFPAETLAALARGRELLLDAQGLVRVPQTGGLRLDADFDPAMLGPVRVLKLSDEEAAVLGDPAALPVEEVIVTHGPRGSTVYAGGRAEYVPAHALDCDATGAGDAFSVAYLAGRAGGAAPAAAARRATAVVAAVLSA